MKETKKGISLIIRRETKLLFAAAVLILISFVLARAFLPIPTHILALPVLLFYSFYRMFFAYVLSFLFSIIYGYYAATNEKARKYLLPLLDVMQSIPILGFFPAAVFFFISTFHGSTIGIEIAAIFLIFTSMAWNMTFGVYESITTIPDDLKSAANSFGIKRFKRFRNLVFPACIPKLVYNSMISWSGGWYFLIASEIISLGSEKYKLPGIGSYLVETTANGQIAEAFAGLAALIAVVLAMDLLLWRPLSVWAEKFRYDAVAGARQKSIVYTYFKWSPIFSYFKERMNELMSAAFDELEKIATHAEGMVQKNAILKEVLSFLKLFAYASALAVALYIAYALGSILYRIIAEPISPEMLQVLPALLFSFVRLIIAYAICILWTVPAAIYIAKNQKAQRYLLPLFETAAAVPAIALFPMIVLLVISFTGSMDMASVLLVLTGMQWYLLFNLIAGVRSIPADLEQAAESFSVKEKLYYNKVLVPAMLPSFVTGSIAAFGGGWNALIVSEYLVYGGKTYSVFGIGSILSKATYETGDARVLMLALFAMILFIFAINNLVWRRLYAYVTKKYRFD